MEAGSAKKRVRIAALGDIHCSKDSKGLLEPIFAQAIKHGDVLVLCGDLTDYGLPEEAHLLVQELRPAAGKPIVAVLGNHDFEAGQQDTIKGVLSAAGIRVLDGDSCEFLGVGFAGVKGYIGGFGGRALQSWGEKGIKQIVHESMEEALKLERALARLRTVQKVAILHYSPIAGTVEGEPLEILPFLGSSRLEEPFNRYPVSAIFHGHAHFGKLEGRTQSGVPVYNVAMALLQRLKPEHPPFRVVDLVMTHHLAPAAQGT
ncbi:MAG: metallophosphoesterase [Elusimicrobia bacterium]|nr:metallophosphoesterase [Elusimicrobiota bacterium]